MPDNRNLKNLKKETNAIEEVRPPSLTAMHLSRRSSIVHKHGFPQVTILSKHNHNHSKAHVLNKKV